MINTLPQSPWLRTDAFVMPMEIQELDLDVRRVRDYFPEEILVNNLIEFLFRNLRGQAFSMKSLHCKVALTSTLALCVSSAAAQSSYDLRSPDKRIEIRIRTANGVRYDVLLKGKTLLQDSALSMNIDHKTFGTEAKVLRSKESSEDPRELQRTAPRHGRRLCRCFSCLQ